MCGGGGGSDAAAQQSAAQFQYQVDQQKKAEEKEAQRQAAIASGTAQINQMYAGYDQPYYDKIANDYRNNYAQPQVDLQQQRDQLQAKFGLARNGILNSSAATKTIGDINQIYGQAATDAAARGEQMAQDRRADVEKTRQSSLAQLQAANDPSSTLGNAAQAVTAYTVSPAAVALTDILSSATNLAHQNYMNNLFSGASSAPSYGINQRASNSAGGRGTTKVTN